MDAESKVQQFPSCKQEFGENPPLQSARGSALVSWCEDCNNPADECECYRDPRTDRCLPTGGVVAGC